MFTIKLQIGHIPEKVTKITDNNRYAVLTLIIFAYSALFSMFHFHHSNCVSNPGDNDKFSKNPYMKYPITINVLSLKRKYEFSYEFLFLSACLRVSYLIMP